LGQFLFIDCSREKRAVSFGEITLYQLKAGGQGRQSLWVNFYSLTAREKKRAVTNKEITFKLLLIKTMISNVLPSSAIELIKVTAYKMEKFLSVQLT
jgi:hypothetical protein